VAICCFDHKGGNVFLDDAVDESPIGFATLGTNRKRTKSRLPTAALLKRCAPVLTALKERDRDLALPATLVVRNVQSDGWPNLGPPRPQSTDRVDARPEELCPKDSPS